MTHNLDKTKLNTISLSSLEEYFSITIFVSFMLALLLTSLINSDFSLSLVIILLFLISVLYCKETFLANKKQDIFSPIFIVMFTYLLWFCIKATWRYFKHESYVVNPAFTYAFILIIISLIFIAIGYYSGIGSMFVRKIPPLPSKLNSRLTTPVSILLLAYSLGIYVLLFKLSGISNPITQIMEFSMKINSFGLTYLTLSMNTMLYLPFALIAYKIFSNISSKKKNTFLTKSIFCFLFLLNLYLAFATASRANLVFLFLNLIIFYHLFIRHISVFKLSVIVFSFFMPVIVLMGLYREAFRPSSTLGSFGELLESIEISDIIDLFMGRFDALGVFMDFLYRFDLNSHYLYGKSFIYMFFHFIPRSLWPGKPLPTPGLITQNLYPDLFSVGLSFDATFIAEALMNFGIPFLLISAILIGVITRFYKEYVYDRITFSIGAFLLFIPFFPMKILLEGFHSPYFAAMILTTSMNIAIIFLIRKK